MTQETLEEVAERLYPENWESIMDGQHDSNSYERTAFINGAKWVQERMYSEEEVLKFIKYLLSKKVTRARSISELEEYLPKEFQLLSGELMENGKELLSEWFEQFKKNKI